MLSGVTLEPLGCSTWPSRV